MIQAAGTVGVGGGATPHGVLRVCYATRVSRRLLPGLVAVAKRILEFDGSVFKVLHKAGIPRPKRAGSGDVAKLEQTGP